MITHRFETFTGTDTCELCDKMGVDICGHCLDDKGRLICSECHEGEEDSWLIEQNEKESEGEKKYESNKDK